MSIHVMSTVWNESKSKGSARMVLLAIADCANHEGTAYPSVSTIARKCAFSSTRSVQEHVQKLVALGELEVIPNKGKSGTNLYRILIIPNENSKNSDAPNPPQTPAESCTPQNPAPPQDSVANPREIPQGGGAESLAQPPQNPAPKLSLTVNEREGELSGDASLPPSLSNLRKVFPTSTATFSKHELVTLKSGAIAILDELTEEDWKAAWCWFTAADNSARGQALWPRSRSEFIDHAAEAVEKIRKWWMERGKSWWVKKNTGPVIKEEPEQNIKELLDSYREDYDHYREQDLSLPATIDEAFEDKVLWGQFMAWFISQETPTT